MGVGERRGGRRAGGRRRANHHRHNHHHHNRRRRHHRHGGGGGGALFAFRWGNRTGTSGPGGTPGAGVTPGKQALLMLFIMFCFFGFIVGMTMANIGGWTSTALGFVGMVILLISFVFIIIFVVICCHMKKKLTASPVGGVEAGNVNTNMVVSTVTLGAASTTTSVGETSYMQPGGVAMGTPGYNQQPGYPGGPAQPYPQPTPNYPVAPYPPPNPNGATQYPPPTNSQYPPPTNPQYPPPTNPQYPPSTHPQYPPHTTQYPPPTNPTAAHKPYPQTGAPPINYTTLHAAPPPPTDSHMGVDPASEDNGVAPPPTYNDVMTGNVKYDEGGGSGAT